MAFRHAFISLKANTAQNTAKIPFNLHSIAFYDKVLML